MLAALALAGCGADGDARPDAALERRIAEFRAADPDASRLVDGGGAELRRRVRAERGRPVVVNQWASWCGPCRAEFPFLTRQALKRRGEVAFLGVNSRDVTDDARRFLASNPTPFAHVEDPDLKVARGFRGGRVWPTTAFYDARGRLNYTKQGSYRSERALVADIERYAR
jgi:thiol-disulfide isomerase/thioredoxin